VCLDLDLAAQLVLDGRAEELPLLQHLYSAIRRRRRRRRRR
jgi:hypothetical protein